MPTYYVNNRAQTNGDYEVHVSNCSYFPSDVKNLGYHSDCHGAVKEANKTHSPANGCYHCCYPCHTS